MITIQYPQHNSMKLNGIHDGDLLIIDRSIKPKNNDIVIAALNGELTVKKIGYIDGNLHLIPGNPNYKPFNVESIPDFEIWGIVTYSVHRLN